MKRIITTSLSVAMASFLFVGCGSSSSDDGDKVTPAEITEDSSRAVMENLITNPSNFDNVKVDVTDTASIDRALESLECTTGSVKIDRDTDGFNYNNYNQMRINILTYDNCKTATGDILDGKIKLEYNPKFTLNTDVVDMNEANAIKVADKNITILANYTFSNTAGYKIEILKNSRVETSSIADSDFQYETLTIDANLGGTNYKVENLKTRTYSKSLTTKICYQSGRIYIDNATQYFDIKEDLNCYNEFIWSDITLQAVGEVELHGNLNSEEVPNILTLEASGQNQITAYKNGSMLETFDTNFIAPIIIEETEITDTNLTDINATDINITDTNLSK